MLIQFRTENHRSLRDEQVLSMVASSQEPDDPRLIRPQGPKGLKGTGDALLPVVAIYGANASGKSNVFHALQFMANAVHQSHRRWEPNEPIPREPFLLGSKSGDPSMYEVDFLVESVRYRYGFVLDDDAIVEEWLQAWPHGRRQQWFTREGGRFDFGKTLRGENKLIEGLTRRNSLFLSAAAQNNHEQLTPIFRWFPRLSDARWLARALGNSQDQGFGIWLSQAARDSTSKASFERRQRVLSLLSSADLGILDFKTEGHIGNMRVLFRHRTAEEGSEAWLPLAQESTGTRALFEIIPALLEVLSVGAVLVLDELNSSLHPMLALEIVRLFQDPKRNPNHAQLLFNTHDTTILGSLFGGPPLRRDQIWFTEKDRAGATHLYPLTDFRPRAAENLERGYLQGRYGAIPFLGPFDSALPSKAKKDRK